MSGRAGTRERLHKRLEQRQRVAAERDPAAEFNEYVEAELGGGGPDIWDDLGPGSASDIWGRVRRRTRREPIHVHNDRHKIDWGNMIMQVHSHGAAAHGGPTRVVFLHVAFVTRADSQRHKEQPTHRSGMEDIIALALERGASLFQKVKQYAPWADWRMLSTNTPLNAAGSAGAMPCEFTLDTSTQSYPDKYDVIEALEAWAERLPNGSTSHLLLVRSFSEDAD